MIIQRLKKLREDKLNREAERRKHAICLIILNKIVSYFETNPTKNKMLIYNSINILDSFDEEYAMNMDSYKPYIIKKLSDCGNIYLEVTYREEYRPELYY